MRRLGGFHMRWLRGMSATQMLFGSGWSSVTSGSPWKQQKICIVLRHTIRYASVTPIEGAQGMASSNRRNAPLHPGSYVRQKVIPQDMTVAKAADLLGIGRPALSNFLNGKAALSQDMAKRLARVFGAEIDDLLNLQAKYDRREEALHVPIVAGRHAPTLVEIRASRIAAWADGIRARDELPALLRRLVHTTGTGLSHANFPAFDLAQTSGPDGETETTAPTPWIPEGRALWELSCDAEPGNKANRDYKKRVGNLSLNERRDTTFLLVTPRIWPKKEEWAAEKARLGEWKDVRAYDASDLEQWLEQSAEAQIWFAERIGEPVEGYRSADLGWSEWADACDPALTADLFPMADKSLNDFQQWLTLAPEAPFVIAAESLESALAVACHLVRIPSPEIEGLGTGAVILDTPEAVRRFRLSNSAPNMAIIHSDRVEASLGDLCRRCHCIIVRPGNDPERMADIKVGLPGWSEFSDALKDMGLSRDDTERLARESGRSPDVLRRRLSEIPGVRSPAWSEDDSVARKLVPAALIGAWRKDSSADCDVVRCLAEKKDYADVESGVMGLLNLPDPPLWAIGSHRGVVSRIDTLFGITKFVTVSDLDNFFLAAERVLSEPDPALELPEDERWAAAVHGKVRDHSSALRKGICETLTLLSLHGGNLFQERLGVDPETRVSELVRHLLTPLTADRLLSHLDDLPEYAEAAPDTFLDIIDADLDQPEPAVFELLKPVEGGPFGPDQRRSGLLWSLECLGWKNLGRASEVLARLSAVPIDDNWANKPIASLEALYRSWLPQTSACLEMRMQSLQMLAERYPEVGWQICVAQLKAGPRFATPSYRPHWRGDASGAGRGVTEREFHGLRRKALDLVLSWRDHDHGTLGELAEPFHDFGDEERHRVWDLIENWAAAISDENAIAAVRDRIRQHALTRLSRVRGASQEALARARATYDLLEAKDPVVRHRWLFSGNWIEPSDEDYEEELDHEAHRDWMNRTRRAAMREIWKERGFDGVIALLAKCGAPTIAGECLEAEIVDAEARSGFLNRCLSVSGQLQQVVELCVSGFLRAVDEDDLGALLASTTECEVGERMARPYSLAPVRRRVWSLLDGQSRAVRDRYWKAVEPEWGWYSESELTEVVERLLNVRRPRSAFYAARFNWAKVGTSNLKRLLREAVTKESAPSETYVLEASEISNAFVELNGREGVDQEEMARLEFMYFQVLEHSEYGIPNLEHRIAESPIDFVQVLALVFDKRDDNGQDPPEWKIDDPENQRALASSAYHLLERIRRMPGTGRNGLVDHEKLSRWITETRGLCAEFGRARIGDEYIGRLLARAPSGEDGIQPSLPICRILENIRTTDVRSGFSAGIFNARGVTMRDVGEGGMQESGLAQQYRSWARQRSSAFPFVGSILESIANDCDRWARWEDEQAQLGKRLDC